MSNNISNKYKSIQTAKRNVHDAVKKDKFQDTLKCELDSKYLKFMNIKKGVICFKANKKLREVINNDDFVSDYINTFITKVLNKCGIDIKKKELAVFNDIVIIESDSKIHIRL